MKNIHMCNFDLNNNRSDKIKNIKLISQLRNNTNKDKLKWDINYQNDTISTYISTYKITKNKELCFTLRCEDNTKIEDRNVLRVLLRIKNLKNPSSNKTTIIKSISLNEYPSLIQLIKILRTKYSNKEFNTIVTDNIDEYKVHISEVIRDMINDLPKNDNRFETFSELYDVLDEIFKSTTIEEINDLLFKAYKIREENLKKH